MVAPTRFVGRKSERHFREGTETLPYMDCACFAAVAERRGRRSLHGLYEGWEIPRFAQNDSFREGTETLPYGIVHILQQLRNVEGAVPYGIVLRVGDSSLHSE